MLIHGLIHFMGFAKAFHYGDMKQLSLPISKPVGVIWMLVAFLFVATFILYLFKKDHWWVFALLAVVLSQVVMMMSWKDAKFGSIANILILIIAILNGGSSRFENTYRKDVKSNLQKNNLPGSQILVEADIQHLPAPVQQYLKYTGVIGKPRVNNMKIVFEGQMREKGKEYFPFTSEQYNFFVDPTRLFFMKGKMFGIVVPGYHKYRNSSASMDIRFFGLFPITKKSGEVMDRAETVTLFNDMCLFAPATLIDKRIKWQPVNDNSVIAIFNNQNISISATLYFNQAGQLVNFISNDRASVSDMKNYPWSTPILAYKSINGHNLMAEGDAIWHYPDGEFVYGKFILKKIAYNLTQ